MTVEVREVFMTVKVKEQIHSNVNVFRQSLQKPGLGIRTRSFNVHPHTMLNLKQCSPVIECILHVYVGYLLITSVLEALVKVNRSVLPISTSWDLCC